MNQTKPALTSTSVWGSLLAIVGALTPLALAKGGVTDSADQQAIINTVGQTAAAIGGVVALVGRLKATHQLS